MRITKICCAVCVVGMLLTSCSSGLDEATPAPASVRVDGASAFFHETPRDWVSYSQNLVVVDVVDEEQLPIGEDVNATGEGYVGRRVVVNLVQELWRAPDGKKLPAKFSFDALGWIMHDGRLTPAKASDGQSITVGKRYLLPLTTRDNSVTPLSGSVVWQIDVDGRLRVNSQRSSAAVRQHEGGQARDVAALLARTPMDPVAAKYALLPPYERVRAVLTEREATQG